MLTSSAAAPVERRSIAAGARAVDFPGMRPRTELATGAVLLLVLGVGAAALGSRHTRLTDRDPRRSSYLAGPLGASGFAEALSRLGVRVMYHRRQVAGIDSLRDGRTLVAFLG